MSFDPNLPANTTKIRNAPTLLQNNFGAIQDGDSSFLPRAINLYDRTVAGVSSDPTAIADVLITYSKTADTKSEMFTIDSDSNVIQLTSAGKLGGPTTALKAATIQYGTNTKTNNQGAMISAWAVVSSAGTATNMYGITSFSRSSTGIYVATIPAGFMTDNSYGVIVTPFTTGVGNFISMVSSTASYTAETFQINIVNRTDGLPANASFTCLLVGGRH